MLKLVLYIIGGLVIFIILFSIGIVISHVRFANKLEKEEPREAR